MIILALDCRNINPSNTVWHALEDDRICWWANSKEDHESGACYLCGSGTILPLYHITGVGPTIKHQRWTANSFSSNGFRIFLQRSQQQLNFTMIAWGFGELGLQELMSWHKYVCMRVIMAACSWHKGSLLGLLRWFLCQMRRSFSIDAGPTRMR